MKRLALLLLLAVPLAAWAADPALTAEVLSGSKWSSDPAGSDAYSLSFDGNGTYAASYYGEGGRAGNSGKWKIASGVLVLTPDAVKAPQRAVQTEVLRYRYRETADTLVYLRFLETVPGTASGIAYWNASVQVPEGTVRTVGGVPVTVVRRKGVLTDGDVNLREKPGTDGARVLVTTDVFAAPYGNYLPKGYDVTVLARTASKAKVGDWENWWYWCDLTAGGGHRDAGAVVEGTERSMGRCAWIYGEFVKVE